MDKHADAPPFRDASHGVAAKREKLLGDRRADLAQMSHDIRRIYVGRCARLGLSIACCLGGLVLLAAVLSPALTALIEDLLPGGAPAPLANVLLATWLLAIAGTLAGRSIGEHRFAVAMSRAVLPSADAHHDVARLAHERPDTVGRDMTHRIGRKQHALAALATSLVLPATGLMGILAFEAGGYPRLENFEHYMAQSGGIAASLAAIAIFFAAALYLRPQRASLVLPLAFGAQIALVGTSTWPYLAVGVTVLACQAWRIHSRHRREDHVLGLRGTPLPRPLQLRKRLLRSSQRVWACLRNLHSWRPRRVHALGASLLAISAASLVLHNSAQPAAAGLVTTSPVIAVATVVQPNAQPERVSLVSSGDGITVKFDFGSETELSATDFLGGVMLQPGWQAKVTVHHVDSSGGFFLSFFGAEAASAPRHLAYDQGVLTVDHQNCGATPIPLEFIASPYGEQESANASLTLRYTVNLEFLSGC